MNMRIMASLARLCERPRLKLGDFCAIICRIIYLCVIISRIIARNRLEIPITLYFDVDSSQFKFTLLCDKLQDNRRSQETPDHINSHNTLL